MQPLKKHNPIPTELIPSPNPRSDNNKRLKKLFKWEEKKFRKYVRSLVREGIRYGLYLEVSPKHWFMPGDLILVDSWGAAVQWRWSRQVWASSVTVDWAGSLQELYARKVPWILLRTRWDRKRLQSFKVLSTLGNRSTTPTRPGTLSVVR